MPDWVEKPVHEAIYSIERSLTQVAWTLDRAVLLVTDLVNHFRSGLVTEGFTQALDAVSTETIGISRPVFELALTLGLLLIIITPIIAFKWVNIRKAMFLFFLIPIGLPLLVGAFQDIDGARGEIGTNLYTSVVSKVDFDSLLPKDLAQPGTGTNTDMGNIRQDFTGTGNIHGADVAAAFLFANRQDVFNPPRSLPVDFERRYFARTMDQFDEANSADRWAQIETASTGIVRMLFGIILVLFAFLESIINLLFTMTMGILLIAFILSLLFAYFNIFEGMTITIIRKMGELFLQSWAISVMQALLMAAVIKVAEFGSGIATLGIGILALWVQFLFLSTAKNVVITAITGFGTSQPGGSGLEATAMLSTAVAAPIAATSFATAPIRAVGEEVWGRLRHPKPPTTVPPTFPKPNDSVSSQGTRLPDGIISDPVSTATGRILTMAASEASLPPVPLLPSLGIDRDIAAAQPEDMRKLVQSLRRHPLPEVISQAMMIDVNRDGTIGTYRRTGVERFLKTEYGLNDRQASRHLDILDARMQRVSSHPQPIPPLTVPLPLEVPQKPGEQAIEPDIPETQEPML